MIVTLHYTPPAIWALSGYEIGESITATGSLTVVASGVVSGVFPEYCDTFVYSSGTSSYYYAVRFVTSEGDPTAYSDRTRGLYDAVYGFIIYRKDTEIYLVPPPVSGAVPDWLTTNTEYTVTVRASGLYGTNTTYMREDYSFFFTSQYDPLWSTVTAVRLAAGPIVEDLPDDTINRIIYKISLQAIRRLLGGIQYYGRAWDSVPEPVFRWVTCMSALMALNAAIISGSAGSNTSKKLGELSITYNQKTASDPGAIRKTLTDCITESEQLLSALKGTGVMTAIKSYSNNYITHPLMDPSWGRNPRKILDNGTTGPWDQSHEYGFYERVSTTLQRE